MSAALGAMVGDEMRRWYRSPLAWLVLALGTGAMAAWFVLLIVRYIDRQATLAAAGVTAEIVVHFFAAAAMSVMVAAPLLTMGLVAGDRREGVLRWLYAHPLGSAELVLAKFAGVIAVMAAYLGVVTAMPLTLLWGAPIDLGVWLCNTLGLVLFAVFHCALGLAASACARAPVVAALVTLLAGAVLWMLDWAARLDPESVAFGGWSTLSRLRGFTLGLLSAGDALYFLVGATAFIALAVLAIRFERDCT